MRIGLYLKDDGISNIDLRYPEMGNPGIGGTEFSFAMLMRYLKQNYENTEVICYHYNQNVIPNGCVSKIITKDTDSIVQAFKDNVDCLLFVTNQNKEFYECLEKYNIFGILWAHCFILDEELEIIASNSNVKKIVFVGREQYDTYIDHEIIFKSTYIYNMFYVDKEKYSREDNFSNLVTYVGSITKEKGFHVLASVWKDVVKQVPNAELHVIGSGKLYRRDAELGAYGIADKEYESTFIKYLLDENNQIMPSVHFHGLVGQGKEKYYNKTAIGVINPTAISETFGISAVEMEACGVPIVTKGKYGLLDTVVDKHTGLLFKSKKQFKNSLISLLSNRELNSQYGRNAKEFVELSFDSNKLISEWYSLFERVLNNENETYIPPISHFKNNFKWMRMISRFLRINLRLQFIPPIVRIKPLIKRIIK